VSVASLAFVLACASFALLSAANALAATVMPPKSYDTPARNAGAWFFRAVGPTAIAAIVVALLLVPSFFMHEQARYDEWPGVLLWALAFLGAARLTLIALRAAQALRASRATVRIWQQHAVALPREPWGLPASRIDCGYPVVAVAGFFKPHVFVDRRVLEACSPEELAAVAAHERAHVSTCDNLRRLLVAACAGHESPTASAWRIAAEHAADARGAGSPRVATDLAAALVRVTRISPVPMLPMAAISTIHDGGSLEARVRQLLAFKPTPPPPLVGTWSVVGGSTAVLVALMASTPLSERFHATLELLVQYLP
jgi:hypothetical protein